MEWDPQQIKNDFLKVSQIANLKLTSKNIEVEVLRKPHSPPKKLPNNSMAIYVFSWDSTVMKVGKAGSKTKQRYTSQHYSPKGARSTLAASILSEAERFGLSETDQLNIGNWIRTNTDRVNFLVPITFGIFTLNLLEAFLHCRLNPYFEGYQSQRLSKDR